MHHDVIIVGSGAGGSAVAYHLAQTGTRVLLLEKGPALPKDGSTLDVERVLRQGAFLADEPWLDRHGQLTVPEEHFNLGGKTKWYGAALLRFAPHEFAADPAHQCLGWPITLDELAPFYDEAERLLGVRRFDVEPGFQRIVAGLRRQDPGWRKEQLALGLAADILAHPNEACHFDGFASVRGLKADAEQSLLSRVAGRPNLDVVTSKPVAALLPVPGRPNVVDGVVCEDGSRFHARTVVLAAGALHSPRLLQDYLEGTGLAATLPCYANVGRNYKAHLLTAMLAFSHRRVTDVLCKTLLLYHERMPHSTVQTLGGNLGEEIVLAQAPRHVPAWLVGPFAHRVVGLFLQTEDGSHRDNRIVARANGVGHPRIDYDAGRLPPAEIEHRTLVRTLRRQLVRMGYLPIAQRIPITGTAHACGTLATGNDPAAAVVDANARVHGLANVYVADGSVLPRSARVNPALTIYAWGLRVATHLGAREHDAAGTVRANSAA